MKYNPEKHRRRSIRLKGYDYAQPGAYFVTIISQNREYLFGNIVDDEMVLNFAGEMVKKWWLKLPEKYPRIQLDKYILMPNHIHGIIIIVGADPRVRPDNNKEQMQNKDTGFKGEGEHVGSPLRGSQQRGSQQRDLQQRGSQQQNSSKQQTVSLFQIMQWFKTMTTNEYIRNVKQNNWPPFNKRVWQRNYHDRIIRNENELNRIREYIINNPRKWDSDTENPGRLS